MEIDSECYSTWSKKSELFSTQKLIQNIIKRPQLPLFENFYFYLFF